VYVCECVRACVCVRVRACACVHARKKQHYCLFCVVYLSCLSFLSVWSEEYIAIALYAVRDDMKTRDAV
jgi:hypothetical protein